MKYRKKPVVIEAMQLTEQDCWEGFLNNKLFWGKFHIGGEYNSRDRKIFKAYTNIETLEGTMTANIGDWIIKGVKGEFYPCKPDIFEATYEPA